VEVATSPEAAVEASRAVEVAALVLGEAQLAWELLARWVNRQQ